MANAVFTTKVSPEYDDIPEVRYHFPKTYYNQACQAVGDWVLYYEPRRQDRSPSGRAGRQSYFATARVRDVAPDPNTPNHYYAFVSDYIEFPNPVAFRIGKTYPERDLRKPDGSTNKGRFGRAVRTIPKVDFERIVELGFAEPLQLETDAHDLLSAAEELAGYGTPRARILSERAERDAAFGKTIRSLYGSTCALTGLRIINGGGVCEIEAAHIRPVSDEGPDSSRNGLALSRTVHWLFDRGIVSLEDNGHILAANELIPEQLRGLLNANRAALLPPDPSRRPHPLYLDYHRNVVCKGKNLRPLR